MGEKPRILFILTCHRSGSSVLAYAVHTLGASLGDNLLSAGHGNPKGHWESASIMHLNDRLLAAGGANWTSFDFDLAKVYANPVWHDIESDISILLRSWTDKWPLIVIKDPRTALVWPIWRDICSVLGIEVSVLAGIRHPIAVIASLAKRDRMPMEVAALLWRRTMEDILKAQPDLVVDYDRLMAIPEKEIGRLEDRFGLLAESSEALDSFQYDFLDPNLQRNSVPFDTATTDAGLNRLWKLLNEMSQQ